MKHFFCYEIYGQYVIMAGPLKKAMDNGHVLVLLSSLEIIVKLVNNISSLPPANEVWGKVMFLLACLILFTGGGSLYDVTSCQAAWSHVPSSPCSSGGLCLEGGSLSRESLSGRPPG